jgi:TPR repeat protein
MDALGGVHEERKELERALGWCTKGAEAGLPKAMYNLGVMLDVGEGMAAPDYPAAADWYKRAADAGHVGAANNLSNMYQAGRGMARQNMSTSSALYTLVPWVGLYGIT